MARQSRTQKSQGIPPPHGGNPTKAQVESHKPSDLIGTESYLAALKYPVKSPADLVAHLDSSPQQEYFFRGRPINPRMLIPQLPAALFPVTSTGDFEEKLTRFFAHRSMVPLPHSEKTKQEVKK